jgi:hypothetical protein
MSGNTMAGIASSTSSESRGLVITIIAAAPASMMRFRSACDRAVPAAALICVVSAVSRLNSSPERVSS